MQKYLIGDKIRVLRSMKGYSQKGLAAAAGLKQPNISYIEKNKMKKTIRQENFEKISKALNMTPEAIENYEPEQFVSNTFHDNSKQEIFIQHLSFDQKDKVISLQAETINTLQNLLKIYKEDFNNRSL